MKTTILRIFGTGCTFFAVSAFAQGTFQNLDFESPVLPLVSVGDPNFNFVTISTALPNWSGYLGGIQETRVLYNNLFGGTATLALLGPGYPVGILEGEYTAVLQAGLSPHVPARADAAIAQTGTIPSDAQSLRFLATAQVVVTFGGQTLSLIPLGAGDPCFACIKLYGADISAFMGQTGELRFTAPDLGAAGANNVFLDDISFSPMPVPEPTVLGLIAFGALLLAWRLHSRSSM